jgi:hypothetical protein
MAMLMAKDVQAAFQKYIDPKKLVIVRVGILRKVTEAAMHVRKTSIWAKAPKLHPIFSASSLGFSGR